MTEIAVLLSVLAIALAVAPSPDERGTYAVVPVTAPTTAAAVSRACVAWR